VNGTAWSRGLEVTGGGSYAIVLGQSTQKHAVTTQRRTGTKGLAKRTR
jgi:hypothetical protein